MPGNHVSKKHRLIDPDAVFAPAPGTTPAGGRQHLNSTLPPDDLSAPTEWTYLTTDGSDDGPYLKAAP